MSRAWTSDVLRMDFRPTEGSYPPPLLSPGNSLKAPPFAVGPFGVSGGGGCAGGARWSSLRARLGRRGGHVAEASEAADIAQTTEIAEAGGEKAEDVRGLRGHDGRDPLVGLPGQGEFLDALEQQRVSGGCPRAMRPP